MISTVTIATDNENRQEEIWGEMRRENLENRIDENRILATTRSDVKRLLASMYDPLLPADALRFHIQDSQGFPHPEAVSRIIAGNEITPTVAFTNQLSAEAWKDVPRPCGFSGPKWPPETADDLLGCSTLGEPCVECQFGDNKDTRDHQYKTWSAKLYDLWLDKIRLCQISEAQGLGLGALDTIYKNTCIGEYTGELVPGDEDAPSEHTQYHYDMPIGLMVAEGDKKAPEGGAAQYGAQSICWLDATRKGSIFRVLNHSCEPNAKVLPGRCGPHHRVLYVYTIKTIQMHDQITISYGDQWYSTREEPCLCGAPSCKNPPKQGRGDAEKDADEGGKKSDAQTKDIERTADVETERKAPTNTKTIPAKTLTEYEANGSRDETVKEAANPRPSMPKPSAQTGRQSRRSTASPEPTQKRRKRLVRDQNVDDDHQSWRRDLRSRRRIDAVLQHQAQILWARLRNSHHGGGLTLPQLVERSYQKTRYMEGDDIRS